MTVLYLVLAALGLSFLIFIHELGHYFVARWVGIRVEAFSIGFGRSIVQWKRNGVVWKIGWLPFGGYVKMSGEERPKEEGAEPVEGGFLAARPIHRIWVALAGPLVNILFALVAFTILWASGGRDRSYAEYSQRVGWLDPNSTLYAAGVRPGDRIFSYDDYQVHSLKDHAYGPMLGDGRIRVQGEKFNPQTGRSTPLSVEVATYPDPKGQEKGLLTLGFEAPAQYLIYDGSSGSSMPMEGSGIESGDRLIWADGEALFSMEQLKQLLNDGRALVTVRRNGTTFLARVPRVAVGDLRMGDWLRQELGDWLYEAKGVTRSSELLWIPYEVDGEGRVQQRLALMDSGREKGLFPVTPYSDLEKPLQPGDQIIAVDGAPIRNASDLVGRLQGRQVEFVVQRGVDLPARVSSTVADDQFVTTVPWFDLAAITSTIGTGEEVRERSGLVLLKPVTPLPYGELLARLGATSPAARAWNEQAKRIAAISDPEQREKRQAQLTAEEKRLALGVQLHDRQVEYNPNPGVMFGRVVVETGRTLQSLVVGDLKPKWLSGPIGIVQVMQYSWALGAKEAIFWLGFISLNLAFLNLLPIPILDGGNIVFSLYEMLTRRRIKAKTMERLIIPFFVLLIGFFIYVTYQDLARIFRHFF